LIALHRTPVEHRAGDGAGVDVFEFTAHRHAAREARNGKTVTMPSDARLTSRSKWISFGPMPSSGLRRPISTK
jgi:hypothetical protein